MLVDHALSVNRAFMMLDLRLTWLFGVYSIDGMMVLTAPWPILQHVSSHRLRPSAPWWMHRGDMSAGPAGGDWEVRMPWVAGKQKRQLRGSQSVWCKWWICIFFWLARDDQ